MIFHLEVFAVLGHTHTGMFLADCDTGSYMEMGRPSTRSHLSPPPAMPQKHTKKKIYNLIVIVKLALYTPVKWQEIRGNRRQLTEQLEKSRIILITPHLAYKTGFVPRLVSNQFVLNCWLYNSNAG